MAPQPNVATFEPKQYIGDVKWNTQEALKLGIQVFSNQLPITDPTLLGNSGLMIEHCNEVLASIPGLIKWAPQTIFNLPAVTSTATTTATVTLVNEHAYNLGNKLKISGTGTAWDNIASLNVSDVPTNKSVTVTFTAGNTYPAYNHLSTAASWAALYVLSEV